MIHQADELIFVYNADSSLLAQIGDLAVKIAAPSNYQCNLCMVTHGSLRMKKEWKDFLDSLPQEKVFLHREEFLEKHQDLKIELPAILVRRGDTLRELVSAAEINRMQEAGELMKMLSAKLESADRH